MTGFTKLLVILGVILATAPALADSDSRVAVAAAGEVKNAQTLLPSRPAHSGVNANLFQGHSWYTPPPPPPRKPRPAPVERKPVAPPLPFEFLGSLEQEGSPTTYFLVKDDRVYDAIIGDKLDETYTIDGVSDGRLMFTYIPLKTSQGLRLGEQK